MIKKLLTYSILLLVVFSYSSCKKDQEVFEGNEPPPYSGISTLQVENYVNRLFIDLIGREPLDAEMILEVESLEAANLSEAARITLVEKLQFNSDSLPGDSSYTVAYHKKLYENTKARLLEGVSDQYILGEYGIFMFNAYGDSLAGDFVNYEINKARAEKLKAIVDSQYGYRAGTNSIQDMYKFMLNNAIYDQINMNTFNFINASFDDLYYRFPTDAEFNQGYPIIENNQPNQFLGEVAQNKTEYVNIMVSNSEYEEGMVRWAFLSILSREPLTNESFELVNSFNADSDISFVQKRILITDEYAGF